jgi:suppressor for copper-sensitivity B
MMRRSTTAFLTILACLWGGMATAHAAEPGASDWSGTEAGRVRLVAAGTATGTADTLRLGLHFQLQPGWKIYWRTPGDAGYPPRIDWTGSHNIGQPVLSWPAPKRFELAGLQNHGYAGEIILPVEVPITRPGQTITLAASVDYLACAQICVPMSGQLALDLPAGPAEPSAFIHDISRFAALVPGNGARHGLTIERLEAVGSGDTSFLRLTVAATEPFDHPDLFVEPADIANFDAPRVHLSANNTRATIESAVVAGTLQSPLAEAPVTITLVDGGRSLEARLVPVPGSGAALPEATPSGAAAGLVGMLAIALLGGLILNLMPCVLPVLSIKVLGAISHGGAERGHVRAAFLASAAGIVASFLALAAAAIAVKAGGQAVGWGIQFQQPLFLAAMATIVTLFAANLWGLFEIRLPSGLMNAGTGAKHHTLAGHFLSGAFATLLATPCSAPFLGTAIGFALARGPAEILAIFATLGLGMAIPFLLVAAWPDAARRLPKPGRWMLVLRKLLALALAATALWLLSVLAVTAGWPAAMLSGGAMAGAVIMLVLRPRMPERSRSATTVSAAALALAALTGPYHLDADPAPIVTAESAGIPWQAFDQGAIATAIAAGQVVFVDVTADWCITCKVNKAAVIERGEVARRLSAPGTLAMRADWTKPDDIVARYLASFGRYGIPFNVVYGPGAPAGLALSELLSEAEVLGALDKATGDQATGR